MFKRSFFLAFAMLLSGCADFDEPSATDPSPIYGCYRAPEAPALSFQRIGVQIAGSTEALPYRYEQNRVGMMLAVPMTASVSNGEFALQKGEEHFYRVIWASGRPVI